MSKFEIVYPKAYKKNNKNIIERIEKDMQLYGNNMIDGVQHDAMKVSAHYLFQGVVGCGKTTLAKLLFYSCRRFGNSSDTKMTSCRSMYEEYLRLMGSEYSDKYDAISELSDVTKKEVLLIDDLGDEKPNTDAAHDYIGGLIEKRYEHVKNYYPGNRLNSVTIITTNLTGQQIVDMYGSRVYDRIQEIFVICKFNDVSFREKKRTIIKG